MNIDSSSGSGRNNERENLVQTKCTFCGGTKHSAKKCFKDKKDKDKARELGDFYTKQTERPPWKCFKCDSVYHIVAKCPKPPKDNKNDERKSVSIQELIVHGKNNLKMVMMITTKRYMYLCHVCMVMTKVLVEILVTVFNLPIESYI